ncbi:MAG TPA: SPFH domain-containing protein, partial [Rhodanobacteraceae bacterium]|nr:SPFH domain-containing protein [Rhodanobacteraceae bacterium]
MPWKEPGDKPREPNDTWGSGDRAGDRDRSGDRQNNRLGGGRPGGGPGGNNDFDLEAQLRRLRQRFGRFGGGPSGLIAIIIVAVIVWFAVGSWTLIDAREAGILLRLGQYEGTLQPGLHLHLPRPFATVLKVDVGRSRTVSDQIRMLTHDDQIALVDFFVQYKVTDPRKFLFAVRDPEDAMRQAT